MRLIGRVVELLDVNIRRDASRDRLILVRRYRAAEWQDKTQTRLFRCMLVRTIDHGRRALEGKHYEIPEVRLRKVRVERQQLTTRNGLGCPAPALEHPADEAAHILDAALLGLGELLVFGDGLVRALCLAETADEVRPRHFLVLPFFVHPRAPYGNRKARVVRKRRDGICLVTHEDPPMLIPPTRSLALRPHLSAGSALRQSKHRIARLLAPPM